jgi:L-amino acid N-acyltransferase YncA
MSGNYHLKKFEAADWQDFKIIRLEALQKEPSVFCPSTNEMERSDEEWIALLNEERKPVFGLLYNDEIIGLTGLVQDREDPDGDTALCVMSYIRKEHRGKGLSRLLYETRIRAARDLGYKKIRTAHRASNEASKRANQRFNFKVVDQRSRAWPDGGIEDIFIYELLLVD